jgi:hypothetical protein
MSNVISANTLFHFTKSFDNIVDIVSNGFYPKCCLENYDFSYDSGVESSSSNILAIPMVCFCDIPLSQISFHTKKYGSYAIGLSKEWGERKGINPVLYELPNSNTISIIKECLRKAFSSTHAKKDPLVNSEANEIGNELLFLLFYLKPYEGKMWDGGGFNGDRIKFYDEREWRYIPDFEKIMEKALIPYMFSDTFLDRNKAESFNKSYAADFKLELTPKDIKYIIVDREKDVLPMFSRINELSLNCSEHEKNLLLTKIISFERIGQDF